MHNRDARACREGMVAQEAGPSPLGCRAWPSCRCSRSGAGDNMRSGRAFGGMAGPALGTDRLDNATAVGMVAKAQVDRCQWEALKGGSDRLADRRRQSEAV